MADQAFNPDQYLAEKTAPSGPASNVAGGFDPDQYLSEKTGQDSISPGKSALIGAQAGLGIGLRPFAAGIGAGAGAFTGTKGSLSEKLSAAKEAFSQGREETNQEESEAAKANPKSYYGANILGGIAPGGLVGKAVGGANSLRGAAKIGALYGGANALSKAHNVAEGVEDVGGGALTGGLVHGAFSAAGAAFNKLIGVFSGASPEVANEAADIISQSAQELPKSNMDAINPNPELTENTPMNYAEKKSGLAAFKGLGPYAADVRNLSPDQIAQKGLVLRDEGVIGGMPTSYEHLADRAEAALDNKGKQFDLFLSHISDSAEKMAEDYKQQGINAHAGIDRNELMKDITTELMPQDVGPNLKKATLKNTGEKLNELLAQVSQGPQSIPIKEAQQFKSSLGNDLDGRNVWKSLKMGNQLSDVEDRFNVAYYHALNNQITKSADAVSEMLGGDFASQWSKLRNDYSVLKTAAAIANKRAGREFVNRNISPSDYFAGLEGSRLAEGSPGGKDLVGLATGLLNHYGRRYGNQVISNAWAGANKASQAGPQYSGLAAQALPATIQTRINSQNQGGASGGLNR